MNKQTVFQKLFHKLNVNEVVNILKLKGLLPKYKNKNELENVFVSLARTVTSKELKDFIEMAVLRKNKGYPAFTYKILDTNPFLNKTLTELESILDKTEHPVSQLFTVTSKVTNLSNEIIELNIIVREYVEQWKTGTRNLDSLTAVYNCKVTINLRKKVITIITGDDRIHNVIEAFLGSVLRVQFLAYRIKDSSSSLTWEDQASYKTALFLDLMYNRLKGNGISGNFKEIKFKVLSNDIKDVTISGDNNIINSYLACEYITLGKKIVQFKAKLNYKNQQFSCFFTLKGNEADVMKITLIDLNEENLKMEVMELIQDEYISMCEKGIKDIKAIRIHLEAIYKRFIDKEGFQKEVLQKSTVANINSVIKLLSNLDKKNPEIYLQINDFLEQSKVLLETLDFDKKDITVYPIEHWLGE